LQHDVVLKHRSLLALNKKCLIVMISTSLLQDTTQY
jgi:hypothetical protein